MKKQNSNQITNRTVQEVLIENKNILFPFSVMRDTETPKHNHSSGPKRKPTSPALDGTLTIAHT